MSEDYEMSLPNIFSRPLKIKESPQTQRGYDVKGFCQPCKREVSFPHLCPHVKVNYPSK